MKTNNIHKNHKKITGFKVPKNYFENFDDALLKLLPEGKNTNNILSQQIGTGLKTPDTYFNTLEDTLFHKIEKEQKTTKVISLFTRKNILSFAGIAAMIAIIISITLPKENKTPIDFDSIAIAEIQEYLDEENIELLETDIATLIEDDINISNIFIANTDNISDDILLDYLSDKELEDEIYYE